MIYASIKNGKITEYPIFPGDLRLRFPHVSFPVGDFDPPQGYVSVEEVPQPEVTATQKIREGAPVKVSGKWRQNWVVTDLEGEELQQRIVAQWDMVRGERNHRLSQSDWTQIADAPLTAEQRAAWAAKRQWLRDITSQSDPFNVEWEPSESP